MKFPGWPSLRGKTARSLSRPSSRAWCARLRAGDKIEIRGFGSFRTRQRKPRVGRNPKTGDRVEVPAKKIPFFKPSKELKDMVNSYVEQRPHLPAAAEGAPEPQA